MNARLKRMLERVGEECRNDIQPDSRNYREIDLGQMAAKLGFEDLKDSCANVYAIIPLKQPAPGMKVRVDGRTFGGYAQIDSGVVVPGYIARGAGIPHRSYTANESMILNFA